LRGYESGCDRLRNRPLLIARPLKAAESSCFGLSHVSSLLGQGAGLSAVGPCDRLRTSSPSILRSLSVPPHLFASPCSSGGITASQLIETKRPVARRKLCATHSAPRLSRATTVATVARCCNACIAHEVIIPLSAGGSERAGRAYNGSRAKHECDQRTSGPREDCSRRQRMR